MSRISIIYSLIWVLVVSSLSAQSWETMFRQYLNGDLDSLPSAKLSVADENNPFYITLRAVFEEDGEQAIVMYRRALGMVTDSLLRRFLADKIYDYYYSKGLYITARKFQITNTEEKVVRPDEKRISAKAGDAVGIYLQFGVFSTEENAERFIKQNQIERVKLQVLKKDRRFYVVSGPYFDETEARQEKERIRKVSRLKPFVKQF